jgi:OOP family OmpA-OmpF porin
MPSKSKKLLKPVGVLVPLSLAVGMVLAPQAMADQEKAWVESHKSAVTNSYGECWDSSGVKDPLRPECGDVIPMDEPPPVVDGDDDGDGVPNSRDKCPNTRPGAKVDSNGCEIIESITINLDVDEFDFDSATLKPEMEAALDDVAARVSASTGDETLSIVGHTDSTGPEAYNQGLSERRAQSVADYLAAQGVDSSRMTTSGMGETSPIADNSTREGRAQNRRVEIQTQ